MAGERRQARTGLPDAPLRRPGRLEGGNNSGQMQRTPLAAIRTCNRYDFLQSFSIRSKPATGPSKRFSEIPPACLDDIDHIEDTDEDVPPFLNSALLEALDWLEEIASLPALVEWLTDIRKDRGCKISAIDVDLRNGIALLEALYIIAPELFDASFAATRGTRENASKAKTLHSMSDSEPQYPKEFSVADDNVSCVNESGPASRNVGFANLPSEMGPQALESQLADALQGLPEESPEEYALENEDEGAISTQDPASPPPTRPQSHCFPAETRSFSVETACGVMKDLDKEGLAAVSNISKVRGVMNKFHFHDWYNNGKHLGPANFSALDPWQLAGYVLLIAVNGESREMFISHLMAYSHEVRDVLDEIIRTGQKSFGMRSSPIESGPVKEKCIEGDQEPLHESANEPLSTENAESIPGHSVAQHEDEALESYDEEGNYQRLQIVRDSAAHAQGGKSNSDHDVAFWMRVAERNQELALQEHELALHYEKQIRSFEQEHDLKQKQTEQLETLVEKLSTQLEAVRTENRRLKDEQARVVKQHEAELAAKEKELKSVMSKYQDFSHIAREPRLRPPNVQTSESRTSRLNNNAQVTKLRSENASLRRKLLECQKLLEMTQREAARAAKSEAVKAAKAPERQPRKTAQFMVKTTTTSIARSTTNLAKSGASLGNVGRFFRKRDALR